MINVQTLPALDLDVGAAGSTRHQPVVAGQILAGIVLGVVIALND